MISAIWRKRLSILQNRLYLYPAPKPLPYTRQFCFATSLVTVAVVLFSIYFILYMTARQDAFLTNAEDFGTMNQAIWNTVHGHMLHQTICNIISDTNCYSPDGVVRFAIHFEPILFPIALLYLIWPDPKMLLVLQTLVVASGAYPAFWLARLRLRNELAGVAIALLYLLYPAQQQATTYDFHAVTFTTALLLFMLYFMYTRRTVLLFVFAILAMACKEEIPLVVIMFGLWSMVFQRRWRTGLGLVTLSLVWLGVEMYIIHLFSPTGQHLLISRYGYGDKGPLSLLSYMVLHPRGFLHTYVLDSAHRLYLHILLSPGGYVPLKVLPPFYLLLLAPWVLVLALPTIALNMLSSDVQQYTGLFQYNAEIVPVLIFAAIEAILLLLWVAQIVMTGLSVLRAQRQQSSGSPVGFGFVLSRLPSVRVVHAALLAALLMLVLFSAVRTDYVFFGRMPFSEGFRWPTVSAHTALAQRFIAMIPPDASVSAQTALVPHLSQRVSIYLFPYATDVADYIFLDVTGDIYPYFGSLDYIREVKKVLLSGNYGIMAAQDGYLLLKRGLPPPVLSPASAIRPAKGVDIAFTLPELPDTFCSYVHVSPQSVTNPLQVTFAGSGGSMNLLGFSVGAPNTFQRRSGYISVTTYWRVAAPFTSPLQVLFLMVGSDGKEYMVNNDVPAVFWCPTNTWKPGTVIQLSSRVFGIQNSHVPNGLAHLSIALVPLLQPSGRIIDTQARLYVRPVSVPATVRPTQGTNVLQLMPMEIVP